MFLGQEVIVGSAIGFVSRLHRLYEHLQNRVAKGDELVRIGGLDYSVMAC